jgi:tetratricopeptide (TPR) repeat protein
VEQCTEARQIRWEIVNACAINDYGRALRLVDQLEEHLPATTVHYHRGRLRFLIAVRNIWEGEVALEYWDLPLGKRPGGARGMWRALNASQLRTAGIQQWPTRGLLTEDDRDRLRDAIKFLEKTVDTSEVLPSTRFMLALSYACIGDGHNAARHYQWMVDNRQRFLAACAQEIGPLWEVDEGDPDILINGIHRCLVNAYDDAGELDNAINAANAWITVCPDQPGTYERMARLYQKRNDYQVAAEWFRKEADRNPSLDEDPNISIILALGSIGTTARIDEALTKIANAHPNELAIAESVVNSYWLPFANLATESKQKWALGTWLLSLTLPAGAGEAAHCFAWVVERELRTTIFAPFQDDTRGRPELFTPDDEDSKPFARYVTGCPTFTLGQMLRTLDIAREPRTALQSSFAQWLNGKNPLLLPRFATVRTDTIMKFRNREDHADLLSITTSDAETMSRACRHLINLLHPR